MAASSVFLWTPVLSVEVVVTRKSNTIRNFPCTDRLVGLVVKASSRAGGPGFESR